MHISIADDLKKRFHAACALRGLKMSQVVAELIEQWLKANKVFHQRYFDLVDWVPVVRKKHNGNYNKSDRLFVQNMG